MPERKSFLLRIDPRVLQAIQRWADDDLRSLNAQIEFLLRRALTQSKRNAPDDSSPADSPEQRVSSHQSDDPRSASKIDPGD